MGLIRRDRKAKAATVWSNQLEERCKSITIVSGRVDGIPFRIALENQHRGEPNNLVRKKVNVLVGFDSTVKITRLKIEERMLLLEWKYSGGKDAEVPKG